MTHVVAHAASHDRGRNEGDPCCQGRRSDGAYAGTGEGIAHQAAQGETREQAVGGEQGQGSGVVSFVGHVLGHKEQNEVADQGHPEEGHEQGCIAGHQAEPAQHTCRGEHHAASHVGKGAIHHIGAH